MGVFMVIAFAASTIVAIRHGINKNNDAMWGWITAALMFLGEAVEHFGR